MLSFPVFACTEPRTASQEPSFPLVPFFHFQEVTAIALPSTQPFSFHILAHSFALFCIFLHLQKTYLFCFHAIPHSLQKKKHEGWGAPNFPRTIPPPLLI